nr:polyphenol oxidase family protein [Parvularcula dongshanensis]
MRAPHGFFGRQGGVSPAPYDSLNCGPGSHDDPAAVAENRDRVRVALGADALATAHQTHSATALFIDAPFAGAPPHADALVTGTPGLAVGALAADCTPVLFHAPKARLVAAAHAGWRGSLAGILEATVACLTANGAELAEIACAFGPCLRTESFEVGGDLVEEVTTAYPAAERFFVPARAPAKYLYDHVGFGRWRLEEAGLDAARIDDVGGNTLGRGSAYFSYRGSRRAGQADYGRNLSAIRLPEGTTGT